MGGGGLKVEKFSPKYYNRWIVLAFYLVAEAFFGFKYSIGLYTEAMKKDLNLSPVEVDLVASFGVLGSCMGFFVGLLMKVVKSNTFRLFIFSAAFFGSGGLLWFYMILSNQIPASFASVCAAWFSANLGMCIFKTCSYQVNVKNFPEKDRGKMCGLTVGIFGASSAVIAVLFGVFFENKGKTGTYSEVMSIFTLYLSIVLFVVVCLSAIPSNFVCPSHIDYVPEHAQGIVPSFTPFLIWGYGLLVILAAITVVNLMEIFTTVSNIVVSSSLLFFIFCGYAIPSLYGSAKVSTSGLDNMLEPGAAPVLSSSTEQISELMVEEGSTVSVSTSDKQPSSLELPWYDGFVHIKYWALLLFSVMGGSSSLLFININSIVISLGINFKPGFVGLLGVANAISRVHSGHLADIVKRHYIPRSCIIFVAIVVAAGNNFLLSIGSTGYLYVGLALGTLCYGYYVTQVSGLMADYFGTAHYAINVGTFHLAIGLGPFVFSTGLVSLFYKANESGFCMVRACFRGPFIITGCSCAVCALIAFFILLKPDYALMHMQKPTKSTSDVGKGENGKGLIEDDHSQVTKVPSALTL